MLDAILTLLLSNTTAILTLSTLSQHCPPTLLPPHSTPLTAPLSHFAALTLYFSDTTAILKLLLSLPLLSQSAALTLYTLLLSQYCPPLLPARDHALLFSHGCSHITTLTPLILRCYYCAAALTLLLSHCCFRIAAFSPPLPHCCCSDCCSQTTAVLTLLSHTAALTSLCSRSAALNCRPHIAALTHHAAAPQPSPTV